MFKISILFPVNEVFDEMQLLLKKNFPLSLKNKKPKQFLFIHISTKLSFARFNLFSRFSLFNTVFLSETNFNSIRTFFKQFYRLPLDVLERHFDATKKE